MAGRDMITTALAVVTDPAWWSHAAGLVAASVLGLVLCGAYLVGDWRRSR